MDNGLQDLARQHFLGEISYQQYRYARRQLIDSIAGSGACDTASAATVPRKRAPPPTVSPSARSHSVVTAPAQADDHVQTQLRMQKIPKPAATGRAPAPGADHRWRWVLAAFFLLALLVLLWYLLGSGDRSVESTQSSGAAEGVQQGSAGQNMVASFLRVNDWSSAGIDNFVRQWDALDPASRQSIRQTAAFQQLADLLYQRTAEQNALENGAASEEKKNLSRLAQALGIDYELLKPAGAAPSKPSVAATSSARSAAVVPPDAPTVAAAASPESRTSTPGSSKVESAAQDPAGMQGKAKEQPVASSGPSEPIAAPVEAVKTVTEGAVDKGAAATTAQACRRELLGRRLRFCRDLLRGGGEAPQLVLIPAGEFQMGSTQAAEERPRHQVRIERAFAMSVYEISEGEFSHYCQTAHARCPGRTWPSDDYPVVSVTWQDAEAYVSWLSQATGQRYRLPSEAEWEYAARAGSTTTYPAGEELLITDARFSAHRRETTPLSNSDRSINPNGFRLMNMVGNVREWVQDAWHADHEGASGNGAARTDGTERVVRGGSYADAAKQLRSAARTHLAAERSDAFTGFRVVREVAE